MKFLSVDQLRNLTDKELFDEHEKVHTEWKKGTVRDELLWNYHQLIITIMEERRLSHKHIDDLDESLVLLGELPTCDALDEMTARQLQGHHTLTHRYFKLGTHPAKDLIKVHDEIVKRLENFDIIHNSPLTSEEVQQSLAPVLPSGKNEGSSLSLNEILPHIKDIVLSEPYIYITGGIVNNDQTVGDIDVLINEPQLNDDDFSLTPLKFRISRMFPEEIRDRLHFITNKWGSPFTSHVGVYRLKLERIDSLQKVEMAEDQVSEEQLIKDIENYVPKELDTRILINDFRLLTAWYSNIKSGRMKKYTEDDLLKLGRKIIGELTSRGVQISPERPNAKEFVSKLSQKVAVLLMSGGKESAALMAQLLSEGYTVYPVWFKYLTNNPPRNLHFINSVMSSFRSQNIMELTTILNKKVHPELRNRQMIKQVTPFAHSVKASMIAIGTMPHINHVEGFNSGQPCEDCDTVNLQKQSDIKVVTCKDYGDNLFDFHKKVFNSSKAVLPLSWSCIMFFNTHCGKCTNCCQRHILFTKLYGKDETAYLKDITTNKYHDEIKKDWRLQ